MSRHTMCALGTGVQTCALPICSPASACAKIPQRGYSSDLLKEMPDAHLAIYIPGAVRGYAHIKTCAPENHTYAAAAIAAELFTVKTATAPHEVIASALAKARKSTRLNSRHSCASSIPSSALKTT